MKQHMNLTITQPVYEPLERFMRVLNKIIDTVHEHNESVNRNVEFYFEIRKTRKDFTRAVRSIRKSFKTMPKKDQVAFEKRFHTGLRTLEVLVPRAVNDLKENVPFIFSFLLSREVRKTLRTVRKCQCKMASHLYPDPTNKIISNPELSQKIIESWGDLADEY